MKPKGYMNFVTAVAMFLLGVCSVQAATVVYEDFQVVSENTIFSTPFEISQAGTYKAELVDFEFPASFDILSLGITQNAIPLGIGFDTGSFVFNVITPGTLLAHLAAVPGVGGVGAYGVQIKAVPVPLPPAILMLLSGFIGLFAVGRRSRWPDGLSV